MIFNKNRCYSLLIMLLITMMTEKKIGRPLSGKAPAKAELIQLYVKEGLSVRAIAEAAGCSKDIIHLTLKRYGIPARAKAKRSKLLAIRLQDIEAEVKTNGLRGAARALGVDHSTLRHHLKARQGK
jgi:lambda repressor-like predicted transcriptional regulator